LNFVLGLAVAVLAAVALWLPVHTQREYREALDAQLEQARATAQAVAVLRERLVAEHEARALLTRARIGRAGMVGLLEVISRALPDGTFLFRLEIARGEINLHGSSEAASSLIAILEATEALHEVHFASPVTRDGATSRERFHIVARVDAAPAAGS
jgi:general secretion pathway protein L